MGKYDVSAAERRIEVATSRVRAPGSRSVPAAGTSGNTVREHEHGVVMSAGSSGHSARKRIVLDGPYTESKELLAGQLRAPRSGRYALVNGLRMYYEVHGQGRGRPLVLLHAALTTIDSTFGAIVRALACTRRVVAVEQQAHGRTADIDRHLTFEQMADDTAELLRQLEIDRADVFGFSMGAGVALELAVRHPDRVRKLAVVSGSYSNDGFLEAPFDMLSNLDPADLSWSGKLREDFQHVGAGPELWNAAVERIRNAVRTYRGLRPRDLRSIRAETLFVTGDDGWVRREHVDDMVRWVPDSFLKVFPGSDHDPLIVRRSAAVLPAFLDARL